MTQVLYAAKGGSSTTSDLYIVNPSTAAVTSVGPTGFALTGLAFNPVDGILYGATSNNSSAHPHSLVTIDPLTGTGTFIGDFGRTIADLACDATGNLFGWDGVNHELATINKATGATALVGAAGVLLQGAGIGFHSGTLYGLFNRPGGTTSLHTINTATGAETELGTVSPDPGTLIAAMSVDDAGLVWALLGSGSHLLFTVNAGTFAKADIGDPGTLFDALAWSVTVGGGGGGEGGVGTLWLVEHYEHEFTAVTVGDPEIEDNGVLLNTVRPENLHFLWQLAELGPSEIDYEISLSAKDEIMDLPVVGLDFVRPYFQDWSLYRGTQLLLAGMITSLTIQAGGESVKIGGKDWLHYLERRCWPYDADLSYVNWPSGFRFKVAAAEVGAIVTDILETVRDVSGNFPGPPNDATFPSYSLKFTVDADSTGTNRNYEIPPFETSSVFDLVRSLSQMDKDDGGFDFYMTPDRPPDTVFKLVYPEIGDPDTPIYTLEIDEATAFANMLELGYTDSGPEASHVLGVGAGTSTRSGGVNKHLRIVSARTRRLDKVGDFGDVKNLATLESKTLADLNRAWRSIHEIPILVDPADITDFWTLTRPGEYVMVNYDLFGHQIDSVQKIVSMDVNVDLEGNERVQLGLNQLVEGGSTDVASDP